MSTIVRGPIDRFRRNTARRLRSNQTEAERRIWRHLRHFAVEGTHFRRQVAIGPYVADFACLASRLLIEIDGSQHYDQSSRDESRTRWLEAEGYRVIRFSNADVTMNIDSVLEAIDPAVFGALQAEPARMKHRRHQRITAVASHPTRRAPTAHADPPPPGEGSGEALI